jgi:hypothetical protein
MIHRVCYAPYEEHRNGNAAKSQWAITRVEESRCFAEARAEAWLETTRGWGLHRPDGEPAYLGLEAREACRPRRSNRRKGINGPRRLFVAKFVRGRPGEAWHGYPADPQRFPQDIPSGAMCRLWLDDEILSPVVIRRMMKGQPCAL